MEEPEAITPLREDKPEDNTPTLNEEVNIENGERACFQDPSSDKEMETIPFYCCRVSGMKKKIMQSFILYFGFFSLGLAMACTGPSLLDLQIITNSTTDAIAYVFTARSAGGLLGGIMSSIIINFFDNWALVTYAMGVIGVLGITLPLYKHLGVMLFVYVIWGIHGVMYDSCGNVTILQIWGSDNGPWMQALHCIFGLGALVGPLIVEPFLLDKEAHTQENGYHDQTTQVMPDALVQPSPTTNTSYQQTSHSDIIRDNVQTNLFTAYLIIGIILVASSLSFIFVICGNQSKSCLKSSTQKEDDNEKDKGTKEVKATFRIPFLIGIFFFYMSYCVLEANYGNFLLAYAVEGLGWTKSMGATCTAVFWASFMIGRALGIIVVKLLSPQVMLGASCTLSVISLLPLLLFANVYPDVLWISSVAIGLTMSTIFATGITWTERYVEVSSGTGAIFLTAGAAGEMLGPIFLSFLYQSFGIISFIYIMFTSASVVLVLYVILQVAAIRQGERYVKNRQQEEAGIEMDTILHDT